MNNNFVEDEDLIYNTSKRIPICICVDTSCTDTNKSAVSNILSDVKKGLDELYKIIDDSDMIRDCAEVSIVTFDLSSNVVQDYTCSSKYNQNISLVPNATYGKSDLGAGIVKSLDLLQSRKQLYNAHGVGYSQPWLVVITDGKPVTKENKKSIKTAAKKTMSLEKSKKLTTITINVSGEGVNNSAVVDGKNAKDNSIKLSKSISPQLINNNKIVNFFNWLGKSIDTLAFENEIKLDFSGLTDWEDI